MMVATKVKSAEHNNIDIDHIFHQRDPPEEWVKITTRDNILGISTHVD